MEEDEKKASKKTEKQDGGGERQGRQTVRIAEKDRRTSSGC